MKIKVIKGVSDSDMKETKRDWRQSARCRKGNCQSETVDSVRDSQGNEIRSANMVLLTISHQLQTQEFHRKCFRNKSKA